MKGKCIDNRIPEYLQQLPANNQIFYQQIQHFLHHFT